MGIALSQDGHLPLGDTEIQSNAMTRVFLMLLLVIAVCSWWVVLISESRRLAQEESNAQSRLLQREIEMLRRTDAALQTAKDHAESANRAKTRYVAGMTHELRTPLNSILGYLQILLKDNTLAQSHRESLQTVQRSGAHMAALVDDLLDLAHIESGRLRLETAPIPLPMLLEEIVNMVRPQAQARGLDFDYVVQGELPAWVKGDARRLTQVLINLLGNAVKFTDAGRVTLRVDARGEVLRFEVEDTGVGVPAREQQRIFLPFERGGAARRRGEAGTGLGLTITGMLTSMMGGDLSMQSEHGKGSTFCVRIYLPALQDPGPFVATLGPVIAYRGRRRTLLVVDDQPDQRQMLAALLTSLGFIVREAASGSECMDSLEDLIPDGVLLDISMDDLDGWETAKAIRARGLKTLPIVLVSANLFDNQPSKILAAQVQAFVGKPVLESELVSVLGRFLRIEWITAGVSGAELTLTMEPEPDPVREPLPAALREEIAPLLRIGHVQGLLDAIDSFGRNEPSHGELVARLRAMVLRFDFEGLISLTREETDD